MARQETLCYWWRVRAKDSHGLTSGWMSQAAFQVNVQNDPPTAPIPVWPIGGLIVLNASPQFVWVSSLDPEGAAVTYQVEVYSNSQLTHLVASVSGLPKSGLLTTTWPLTPALSTGGRYYWRVRSSDGVLNSAWSATQEFRYVKLAQEGNSRFAAKPGGLNGLRVATIGSLGGLTGGETEAIFFYQTDQLGTPLMMTDQTGQVVWKAESLPFGEPVSVNEDVDGDGVAVVNNLRFPGQYQDQETGLNQNWFREYYPQVGRYVEVDPLLKFGNTSQLAYTYVDSNPLIYTDPTGLTDECGKKKCKGKARILGGNPRTIGKTGGFPGISISSGSAAIIPDQWGGKSTIANYLSQVSCSFAGGGFSGISDVIGGKSPTPGVNVRDALKALNPGLLIIELPGGTDHGVAAIECCIPNGLACPQGTTEEQ